MEWWTGATGWITGLGVGNLCNSLTDFDFLRDFHLCDFLLVYKINGYQSLTTGQRCGCGITPSRSHDHSHCIHCLFLGTESIVAS